jgi:hypothetical protein
MKKTVRLTESDLTRIVGKVLSEQPESIGDVLACKNKGLSDIKSALNSGALEKIEFDYKGKGAAFIYMKGKGKLCGIKMQDFMGMF